MFLLRDLIFSGSTLTSLEGIHMVELHETKLNRQINCFKLYNTNFYGLLAMKRMSSFSQRLGIL